VPFEIHRTVDEIRSRVVEWRNEGLSVSLVPTMGGLHAGHLALIKHAEMIADRVVVTLFVNPTQFNNREDLTTYPGNEVDDMKQLVTTGVAALYAPSPEVMYPKGFSTAVHVDASAGILCDRHRPGHFDGVTTVCAKLFNQIPAQTACFGEKDYQQLFVIRRMVEDLNLSILIEPVPTIREEDGLALSSRNARLSKEQREAAPILHQVMIDTVASIHDGLPISKALEQGASTIERTGCFELEYFELRRQRDLDLAHSLDEPCRLFVAASLGTVRLIDNVAV